MGRNGTGEFGTLPPRLLPGSGHRRKKQVLQVIDELGQVEDNIGICCQRVDHGCCVVYLFRSGVEVVGRSLISKIVTFSRTYIQQQQMHLFVLRG